MDKNDSHNKESNDDMEPMLKIDDYINKKESSPNHSEPCSWRLVGNVRGAVRSLKDGGVLVSTDIVVVSKTRSFFCCLIT